ncbi:hypothetical protein [Achromobacter aegrifaciens]
MSTQYDSYDQVPWYRRWWFAVIGAAVFMPAIVVMAFWGGFYFSKDGKVKAFPKWYRFVLLGICLLALAGTVLEQKVPEPEAARISEDELKAMFQEAMKTPVKIQEQEVVPGPAAGEACYEARLKSFREGIGEEALVRTDVMNEWRGECGLPPL